MKAGAREERRDAIMDITVELLAERGYRETSMLEVARRASASKETLYAWFGDKRGLFEAIIRRNAETVQSVLARHLEEDASPQVALKAFGAALLTLLLGDSAVAINRAAISEARSDPLLAQALASAGREATLPAFIRFLEQSRDRHAWAIADASEAAETFLGLLLGDIQVRRLLGLVPPLSEEAIKSRAARATQTFLRLYTA